MKMLCEIKATFSLPGVSSIFDLSSFEDLIQSPISTGSHCFGCTAGVGSS